MSEPTEATQTSPGQHLWDRFVRLDERVLTVLRRISLPVLRISLAVIFVWFGALKVLGVSPATELVAGTVYLVDPAWFVPVLGIVEVAIGLGLLLNRLLRLVLLLFAGLMAGTLLTFGMLPDIVFEGRNPLLLTVEGGYVIKNVVLLAAGLVVASSLRRARPPRQVAPSRPDVADDGGGLEAGRTRR